ncbi:hypothetical protein N7447_000068 [Penicillium robsamsonii]|uniref:uncharacterized protein n=1 Tax=Penicillium robsamsonii TaxID=1792511 RepID=UPI0025497AF5|nr:uncharacterized protein N7447_000068 [Penicillium robsamsonii]KAJ5834042.1 hypothetical protein N7447_000068 [Penicillium robsamsonii]
MTAAKSPKSVVEFLHEILVAPGWNDRIWQAAFCLAFLFCWSMTTVLAELTQAWTLRFLSLHAPLNPPPLQPHQLHQPYQPQSAPRSLLWQTYPQYPQYLTGAAPQASGRTSGHLHLRHSRSTMQSRPPQQVTPDNHFDSLPQMERG